MAGQLLAIIRIEGWKKEEEFKELEKEARYHAILLSVRMESRVAIVRKSDEGYDLSNMLIAVYENGTEVDP